MAQQTFNDLLAKDAFVANDLVKTVKLVPANIDSLLGFVYTHLEKDKLIAELTVTKRLTQPSFILHGGVNVVLAESGF